MKNLLLPALLLAPLAAPAAEGSRPNIVFILSDDVGWGDLGCYGGTKTRTPNLDRLAAGGTRFTRVYAPAPVCSATRYGLLTGRYHWRDGVNFVMAPDEPLAIARGRSALPLALKAAGYATGVVGKWHLGFGTTGPNWNGELKPGPLESGFDDYYGYAATQGHVPCVYIENHRVVGLDPADPIRIDMKSPLDDGPTGETPGVKLKITPEDHAHAGTVVNGISRIGYMSGGTRARWKDEEMADRLTGKAVEFIEKNRARPFFLYFATHGVHAPFWPNPRFRDATGAGLRGDVLMELDASVGEILKTLDRLGLTDNTLVIFTSDNGAGNVGGFWLDPGSVACGHLPNRPWRGGKGSLFEGGVRMPFLARWPGHVPAGKVSDAMFGLVDMPATMAALTGQPAPSASLDSVNALAALASSSARPVREALIGSMDGKRFAVWEGPWKLHVDRPGAAGNRRAELYNLADDPGETSDRAAQQPEVVRRLQGLLDREIARASRP